MSDLSEESNFTPATQPWVHQLSVMQQSVLLSAIRGPDGLRKNHVSKLLLRWYRRCILISAFDRMVLERPFDLEVRKGGSFTGPSIGPYSFVTSITQCRNPLSNDEIYPVKPTSPSNKHDNSFKCISIWEQQWPDEMHKVLSEYIKTLDETPHHFQLHFMHAAEILGYKHHDPKVKQWWHEAYLRLVNDMHLNIEPEEEMDRRLGDSEPAWREKADVIAD